MAYVTVDEIVMGVLADTDQNTTHDYLRLLHLANRGLKELTFDILGGEKVTILEVGDDLKVDLPSDYVDYTFIGVLDKDYNLQPLGRSKKLPVYGDANQNFAGHSEHHYIFGGLYGLGGGQNNNGYYSPIIDVENWQMVLGSIYSGQTIYMAYISDGRQEGGQNYVHPYAEEALIAWTYWKSIARKSNTNMNEKMLAKQEYYNEKRKARARLSSFTKEEALQQFRKGFKQAPKL
jgi:hypothetical protein